MLEIHPRERVGELVFGASRAETRAALGATGEIFRRSPAEPVAQDMHSDAGLFLSFDLDGRLHTVEMTPGAEPALYGIPLLGSPLDEVLARLRDAGLDPVRGSDDLAMPELGLVVGGQSVLASVSDHVVFEFDFFPAGPPVVTPESLVVTREAGFGHGVAIGATRELLRELLGAGIGSVPPVGGAAEDTFMGSGIVATYDENDVAIRLTAKAPAQPTFEGMPLIGRAWDELLADAAARNIEAVAGEAEIAFPAGGFHVWPLLVSGAHPIVAVSISAVTPGA